MSNSCDWSTITESLKELVATQTLDQITDTWNTQKVTIKTQQRQTVLCDETEFETKYLTVQVKPQSLKVLVPKYD